MKRTAHLSCFYGPFRSLVVAVCASGWCDGRADADTGDGDGGDGGAGIMDRKVVLCVGVRCRCLPPLPSLSCPNFFVERGRAFRWEN